MMGAQDAIEELEAKVEKLQSELAEARKYADEQRELHHAAELRADEAEKHFADLKERVANLGVQNAEMRGYIGRVQEDDVVREDLVQVGDVVGGESYLQPKRKHRHFLDLAAGSTGAENFAGTGRIFAEERRRPRRHWVNY